MFENVLNTILSILKISTRTLKNKNLSKLFDLMELHTYWKIVIWNGQVETWEITEITQKAVKQINCIIYH